MKIMTNHNESFFNRMSGRSTSDLFSAWNKVMWNININRSISNCPDFASFVETNESEIIKKDFMYQLIFLRKQQKKLTSMTLVTYKCIFQNTWHKLSLFCDNKFFCLKSNNWLTAYLSREFFNGKHVKMLITGSSW